jgi:hypothetical protein
MSDQPVVLVVPPVAGGRLDDIELQKWLSRGDESVAPREESLLASVLRELGLDCPGEGLAALRYLGDTGDRPAGFVCAADPVHFQTRMRDLLVQSIAEDQLAIPEVGSIVESLQDALGSDEGARFVAAGRHVYLFHPTPFATAGVSSRSASGTVADRFMPSGRSARDFHRLQSEIQMLLHDHAVNKRRDEKGQARISSLWLWGGGSMPETDRQRLPPYFGVHALLKGYWLHHGESALEWSSSLARLGAEQQGAVVDLTMAVGDELVARLHEARRLLYRGKLRRLSLVSQDGICIRLERRHRWRFWKTGSTLTEANDAIG